MQNHRPVSAPVTNRHACTTQLCFNAKMDKQSKSRRKCPGRNRKIPQDTNVTATEKDS